MLAQHSRGVVGKIVHFDRERVAVDECCVGKPVGYGVLVDGGFHDDCRRGVEVERLDARQLLVAVAEVDFEVIGFGSLALDVVAVGLLLGEGSQHEVVGQKMGVARLHNVGDMQRVAPQSVLSDVGLRRWHDHRMQESHLLALCIPHIVGIDILQGKHAVAARSNALDMEAAPAVGARDALHGCRTEQSVGSTEVRRPVADVIQTHEYALNGFQVLGFKHRAPHLKRVDMVAR